MKLSTISAFLATALFFLFLFSPELFGSNGDIFYLLSLAAQTARMVFAKSSKDILWAGAFHLLLILAWLFMLRGGFTPVLNAFVVLALLLTTIGFLWKKRSFRAAERS